MHAHACARTHGSMRMRAAFCTSACAHAACCPLHGDARGRRMGVRHGTVRELAILLRPPSPWPPTHHASTAARLAPQPPAPQPPAPRQMLYDNPQLVSTYLDAMAAASASAALDAAPGGAPGSDSPPSHGGGGGGAGGGSGGAGVLAWAELAVRGTLDYLLRDMAHPEGGLYSAEDADRWDRGVRMRSPASLRASACTPTGLVQSDQPRMAAQPSARVHPTSSPHRPPGRPVGADACPLRPPRSLDPAAGRKREGAFYVWAHAEVVSVLQAAGVDPAFFCEVYDVRPGGERARGGAPTCTARARAGDPWPSCCRRPARGPQAAARSLQGNVCARGQVQGYLRPEPCRQKACPSSRPPHACDCAHPQYRQLRPQPDE